MSAEEYSKVTAPNNSQKCALVLKELRIIFKRVLGFCDRAS